MPKALAGILVMWGLIFGAALLVGFVWGALALLVLLLGETGGIITFFVLCVTGAGIVVGTSAE